MQSLDGCADFDDREKMHLLVRQCISSLRWDRSGWEYKKWQNSDCCCIQTNLRENRRGERTKRKTD